MKYSDIFIDMEIIAMMVFLVVIVLGGVFVFYKSHLENQD